MAKIILGVHGLANKPQPDKHAGDWKKAILEGLKVNEKVKKAPEFDFRLVYWANLLYKHTMHEEAHFSFDSLYDSEPYAPAEPGTIRRREESFLDTIRTSLLDLGGSAIDAARLKLGQTELADWLLTKVARDLAFYYDGDRRLRDHDGKEGPARKAIDGVLARAIVKAHEAAAGDEIMLVSHSMGTIISYNVLRDLGQSHPGMDLPYLVTLGSPLGLPFVKNQIVKERKYDPAVRTPTVVSKRWINYADPKDGVSADVRLRDDYEANARKIRVEDDSIHNDYRTVVTRRDGTREVCRNHHKIYGYLRTPEISELFKEFLGA